MQRPRILLTGASGFVGRHLLEDLRNDHVVHAWAHESREQAGVGEHGNVRWTQVDVSDAAQVREEGERVRASGPLRAVIHLAAFYDFSEEEVPEYRLTNLDGLDHVVALARDLRPARFLFTSSVAACAFPPPGRVIDERSPAAGDGPYARTKREGERRVRALTDETHVTVVRLAALYSDWCEYRPLSVFLDTWLSRAWNRRMLAGRGRSGIPYLHVRDAVAFFRRWLERGADLPNGEVLLASPDGATTHGELFEAATRNWRGEAERPLLMPRAATRAWLRLYDFFGRVRGVRPFERPWMGRYIDLQLRTDASRTRAMLGWAPRARLHVLRRMPFLIENLRAHPGEWERRNHARPRPIHWRNHLRVQRSFARAAATIERDWIDDVSSGSGEGRSSLARIGEGRLSSLGRRLLHDLEIAVRAGQAGPFATACRGHGQRWLDEGVSARAAVEALRALERRTVAAILEDAGSADLGPAVHDHVGMTVRFGIDQVRDVYERADPARRGDPAPEAR